MFCSQHHRGPSLEYSCGIDVSLEQSSLCLVDGKGRIVREAKVPSERDALITWFQDLDLPLSRIGLEAVSLSQWLYARLAEAGQTPGLPPGQDFKPSLYRKYPPAKIKPDPHELAKTTTSQ